MAEPTWPDFAGLLSLTGSGWAGPAARCGAVDPDATSPYEAELDAVARAVPSRRAEFLTGRALARAALADLGRPAVAIARGDDRSPGWPPGILGSITHTRGLCAAIVVPGPDPTSGPAGIGIDAEVDALLDPGVIGRVLTARERDELGDRLELDAVAVFSAKEALFKAIHPATGVWFEPAEVELRLGRDDRPGPGEIDGGPITVRWWAHQVAGLHPGDVAGRWARVGPWVVAGVHLRGAAPPP